MSDVNAKKNSPDRSKTQIDQSNVAPSSRAGISNQLKGKKRSMDEVKSSAKSSNSASASNDNANNTAEASGDDLNDVTPQDQNEDDQSESEVEGENDGDATQPTSVSSKRAFSSCGHVITDTRTRLQDIFLDSAGLKIFIFIDFSTFNPQ